MEKMKDNDDNDASRTVFQYSEWNFGQTLFIIRLKANICELFAFPSVCTRNYGQLICSTYILCRTLIDDH